MSWEETQLILCGINNIQPATNQVKLVQDLICSVNKLQFYWLKNLWLKNQNALNIPKLQV